MDVDVKAVKDKDVPQEIKDRKAAQDAGVSGKNINSLNPLMRSTIPFKLKPKLQRNFMVVPLKEAFGFVPEVVVVEAIIGQKNMFVVRAVLTDDEVKKYKEATKAKKKLMKGVK